MRVTVLRNDMPGPIFLADLESVSQRNPSVDPPGQARYLSYPTVTGVESVLADSTTGAGATITGADISGSFPLTLVLATSDDLKLKTAAGDAFTTYTIAAAAYANITDLVAAINVALAGSDIRAFDGGSDNVVLESLNYGVDSYLENDDEAGGSNANVELGLADGSVRNMPAASAFFTGAGLPGGPLDVEDATLAAVGATTNADALQPHLDAGLTRGAPALGDYLAPTFADTHVARDSALVGNLSEYRNAAFNPDPRNPAVSAGAAVAVVENDGSTPFADTLPTISSATLDSPGAGDVTIAGTSLGSEAKQTVVKFTGDVAVRLEQAAIENAGGSVAATAVVIPASLIPGAATTTTSVQVQVRQRVSGVEALA